MDDRRRSEAGEAPQSGRLVTDVSSQPVRAAPRDRDSISIDTDTDHTSALDGCPSSKIQNTFGIARAKSAGQAGNDAARLAPERFSGVAGPSELQPHAPMVPPFVPHTVHNVRIVALTCENGSSMGVEHQIYALQVRPNSAITSLCHPSVHVEVFTVLRIGLR